MAFSYSGSFKVQLVMSLILFILYGCSVWEKKKKSQGDDVRRALRREREQPRVVGGGVLRKKIFSAVACIMNEGALCLKLQPAASLQGLLGRVGAL